MIARYSVEHKVNMGNYEHTVFALNVQADNVDDYPGLTDEELITKVKSVVFDALSEDIINASLDTAQEESYIHRLAEEINPPKRKK